MGIAFPATLRPARGKAWAMRTQAEEEAILNSGDSAAIAELQSEKRVAYIRKEQVIRLIRYAIWAIDTLPDDRLWALLERATGKRPERLRRDGTLRLSLLLRIFHFGLLPIVVRWCSVDMGDRRIHHNDPINNPSGYLLYEELMLETYPRQGEPKRICVDIRTIKSEGSAIWLLQNRPKAPDCEKARAEALAILREYDEWLKEPDRGEWLIVQKKPEEERDDKKPPAHPAASAKHALTTDHEFILKEMGKNPNRCMTVSDLSSNDRKGKIRNRETVGRLLTELAGLGLVYRPHGKRKGYALTEEGRKQLLDTTPT